MDPRDQHASIHLSDGRRLGYLEVGEPKGPVVIHCHGGGSSRLEALFLAEAAAELGVRLIGIDRPGIGRSDPHAYPSLIHWASDVAEVADRLSVDCFAIQGMSKGGPYALACAYALPDRVRACGLISTVPPTDALRRKGPKWLRFIWWLGGHWPGAFLTLA
ncbi:MAG: alpha/beta fold hydrolase, partial [Stellaceae bacterium]